MDKHANDLINESSPYLLQHAHNPVDWMPWGPKALELAKDLDKPLLISIGYSACHWCHVMEHESFEDTAVARLMNKHFVCIKVDREERPDIDKIYMDAVQIMTGRGGWPLNCIATSDGRPFFGGTYFPKDQWIEVLHNIAKVYKDERPKVEAYANKLTSGINQMSDLQLIDDVASLDDQSVQAAVAKWKQSFDLQDGGQQGAPKFPIPNNLSFLLQYAHLINDQEVLEYVNLTLNKMARGGINDQIGGGFARYSTDAEWKVPHFEKMLYDNGQLLALYSDAYLIDPSPRYLEVIDQTAAFMENELFTKDGYFYSALDADSEGEEGKFYVWTKDELKTLAGSDWELIQDYFHVDQKGLWEKQNYILLQTEQPEKLAAKYDLTTEALQERIEQFRFKAMAYRSKRIAPRLDDKTLTSWNAIASKGFVRAYAATQNERYLQIAKSNLDFLIQQQRSADGSLWHSFKDGKSTITGFLEDYAMLIDALLAYYEVTFDETYIHHAKSLLTFVEQNFTKTKAGFFAFQSSNAETLIANNPELTDNVIPASNSVLATSAFKLALLFNDYDEINACERLCKNLQGNYLSYPSGYSQWMTLQMNLTHPFFDIAILGSDCEQKRNAMIREYIPNSVLCGAQNESQLPVLENKKVEGKTLIYVCERGACQAPTEDAEKALSQVRP